MDEEEVEEYQFEPKKTQKVLNLRCSAHTILRLIMQRQLFSSETKEKKKKPPKDVTVFSTEKKHNT